VARGTRASRARPQPAPGDGDSLTTNLGALRADLDRFAFLLGGNDSEFLLGDDPP
jgi:hypothetical protein